MNQSQAQHTLSSNEIRTMLLARAMSSARELTLLLPLQRFIILNETELGIRLDSLGLCFCRDSVRIALSC